MDKLLLSKGGFFPGNVPGKKQAHNEKNKQTIPSVYADSRIKSSEELSLFLKAVACLRRLKESAGDCIERIV